jgi:dsRNA-specific ribonuclease
MYHTPPRYKEIAVVGPPHDRIFTMGVLDPNDNVIATATARNKKVAEQEASRATLDLLESGEAQDAITKLIRGRK